MLTYSTFSGFKVTKEQDSIQFESALFRISPASIIKLYNYDWNQGITQLSRAIDMIEIHHTIFGDRSSLPVPD